MKIKLSRLFRKLRAINERYREPRMVLSPLVRKALLALRIYLFALVALMLFKFITLVQG
jgi:hypothetical protein